MPVFVSLATTCAMGFPGVTGTAQSGGPRGTSQAPMPRTRAPSRCGTPRVPRKRPDVEWSGSRRQLSRQRRRDGTPTPSWASSAPARAASGLAPRRASAVGVSCATPTTSKPDALAPMHPHGPPNTGAVSVASRHDSLGSAGVEGVRRGAPCGSSRRLVARSLYRPLARARARAKGTGVSGGRYYAAAYPELARRFETSGQCAAKCCEYWARTTMPMSKTGCWEGRTPNTRTEIPTPDAMTSSHTLHENHQGARARGAGAFVSVGGPLIAIRE